MVKFFFDRLNLSNKVMYVHVRTSRKFLFRSKCKRRFYFLSHRVTWLVLRETDDSSNIHDSWWFIIVVPNLLPIFFYKSEILFFLNFLKISLRILIFWHSDTHTRKANWTPNKKKDNWEKTFSRILNRRYISAKCDKFLKYRSVGSLSINSF